MSLNPMLASLLLASAATRWLSKLDSRSLEHYAIWGAVLLVCATIVVAIYLVYSRRTDHELRQHSRRYQHASRTGSDRGRRHRRRRRHQHEELPRNPTLAETGGLPSLRGSSPPGESPP